MTDVTFPLALIAGLLSFLSPCVLPLVLVYLSNLTGVTLSTVEGTPRRSLVFLHALAFVLGFTFTFVVLFGLPVGLLGNFMARFAPVLVKIGGALLILFGLHTAGLVKIPLLYSEKRLEIARREEPGYLRSFLFGMTFAAGWMPCVGPILGAVIAMAFDAQNVTRAIFLLMAYSAGLGLPFLTIAILWTALTGPMQKLKRHMRLVSLISGLFLIAIGALLLTDTFRFLNALFARLTPLWLIERT